MQRELDALLEGKDLAAEAVAEREAMRAAAPKPFGLVPAWEKQNGAQGLAVDQSQKTIYALTSGRLDAFNAKGEAGASVEIDGQFQRLRLAEFDGQAGAEFVAFDPWGRDAVAIGSSVLSISKTERSSPKLSNKAPLRRSAGSVPTTMASRCSSWQPAKA